MKKMTMFPGVQILSFAVALTIAGCYTQLGSVRSEQGDTEEYSSQDQEAYESQADSNAEVNRYDYYGGFLPSPYYRYSFSYYYPTFYWGWYDPFYSNCYSPFFYDPWICGTPFIAYRYPSFYFPFGYGYPYFGGGFYDYPRVFVNTADRFRGSRKFGSTRGPTSSHPGTGSLRGPDYISPPSIPGSTTGTTTLTGNARGRGNTPSVNNKTGSGRTERGVRTESTKGGKKGESDRRVKARSRGRDGGSSRGESDSVKRYIFLPPKYAPPNTPSRQRDSGKEQKENTRDASRGERSGGNPSYTPPASQSTPRSTPAASGRSSGTSERGSSSRGQSHESGGRSGGSTRGSR